MKCPYCRKPIEYTDTIDTENYNEQYTELETYYCENCNKVFLREVYWKLVYDSEQWKEI